MPSRAAFSTTGEAAGRKGMGSGIDSTEAFIFRSASDVYRSSVTSAERPPNGGLSRPSSRREARSHANRSSVDPRPIGGGTAGVGTFPDGLGLAVAPASKGLFPQPVSMSEASLGERLAQRQPRRVRGFAESAQPN
jgi:hypothetical protein